MTINRVDHYTVLEFRSWREEAVNVNLLELGKKVLRNVGFAVGRAAAVRACDLIVRHEDDRLP
jgi:hypothetical protein